MRSVTSFAPFFFFLALCLLALCSLASARDSPILGSAHILDLPGQKPPERPIKVRPSTPHLVHDSVALESVLGADGGGPASRLVKLCSPLGLIENSHHLHHLHHLDQAYWPGLAWPGLPACMHALICLPRSSPPALLSPLTLPGPASCPSPSSCPSLGGPPAIVTGLGCWR
ncbi:hypothetical protein B0I35DRAFT_70790 [Stachybotrys elegans]|uniref:Uncharacterized protein n=1 Tax=Stachybotrys elegans TaxID=80388 RepID=A0A8K0SGU0_9HYPO|nr:hypothetical protein B0I35DRAFT_70790 [Stachybotrys elegans]